jgi:hypothetical protein
VGGGGAGVAVGFGVGACTGRCVGVATSAAAVGVAVARAVGAMVGDGVGGTGVAGGGVGMVGVIVGVTTGAGVNVAVGIGVGLGVAVGSGVGVSVGGNAMSSGARVGCARCSSRPSRVSTNPSRPICSSIASTAPVWSATVRCRCLEGGWDDPEVIIIPSHLLHGEARSRRRPVRADLRSSRPVRRAIAWHNDSVKPECNGLNLIILAMPFTLSVTKLAIT